MERWLFRKVEMWIVLLLLTAGLAGAVLYGQVVRHVAQGGQRAGRVGDAAFAVAGFPRDVVDVFRHWLRPPAPGVGAARFEGWSGLVAPAAAEPDPGWLLMSSPDGGNRGGIVELIDLGRGETVHAWRADRDAILGTRPHRITCCGLGHPYVQEDGSLLAIMDNRLLLLDRCSNLQWVLEEPLFHHSIERDADGHFWVPFQVQSPSIPGAVPDVKEDGLARISRAGRILALIPLSRALIAGGYRHLFYAMVHYLHDPMHMNDIQPVLADGRSWRRGDLLVSLRTHSVILLYRPSRDEIVWLAQGPWLHQHDVNIVDAREISVFSNNAARKVTVNSGYQMLGTNDVYLYDAALDRARAPWRDALRRNDVRTSTQGRATVLAGGDLFVEETEHGRALRVGADGEPRWTYVNVNRRGNGEPYRLGWSRYLDAGEGAQVAAAVAGLDCPPA